MLIARNPSTGEELGRVEPTTPERLREAVQRARAAQEKWRDRGARDRAEVLERWRRILERDSASWIAASTREVGKPRQEALTEHIATMDAMLWTIRNAGRVLKPRGLGSGWQRLFLMSSATLGWRPWGVVGVWGTWNYPVLLNAPPIAQALAAGNAVIFKPSEQALLFGPRFEASLREAGIPEGLVEVVNGGADLGALLTEQAIDKGMFTGGTKGGFAVMGALGRRGVPMIAELSGFDAAIVMPDAPLEATSASLAWSAFVGCGQTCVAIKRVYVVGDPEPWGKRLAEAAEKLRIGDPSREEVDLGPMISPQARDGFDRMVQEAIQRGARVLAGGRLVEDRPGSFYRPTVLATDADDAESPLEGSFGPVTIVRGFPDPESAARAANASRFGLSGCVWGKDRRQARRVASRLQAGVVGVNEAVVFPAHASAPFGGVKASGHGRTHGEFGLKEFAEPVVVHERAAGGWRPQCFPYDSRHDFLFKAYRWWRHR